VQDSAQPQAGRWLAQRWRAVAGLVVALTLGAVVVPRSLGWVGTTFPGFLLLDNDVVPSVSGFDWPSDKTRLFHAQVIAVDGERVQTSGDVYERVAARPVGTPFRYTFRKAATHFESTLPSRVFDWLDWLQVYGVLLVIGASNFGTAIAVAYLQPTTRPARVYFWTTFIGGLFATLALTLHHPGAPFLDFGYYLAEAFFPAAFVHLALVFPVDRLASTHRRPYALVPYVFATGLAGAKLHGLGSDPPDLGALHVNYLFIAGAFVCFLASAVQAYVANADPLVRPRLRVVLLGIVAGSMLSFTAFVDNALGRGHIPMQLGVALVPIFFVTIAYAIAKHDLFDVDRLVRQGFVYGTLSVIVVGSYALVVLLPARFVPELASRMRVPLGMGFVLLLALGLDPLRRLVQGVVDRAFYRARLHYQPVIETLSESLTTLLEVSEVVAQVAQMVTKTLQVESTSIALLVGSDRTAIWICDGDGRLTRREGDAELAALGRNLAHRGRSAAIRRHDPRLDAATRDTLARWGATLSLPLVVKERAVGLLLLGPRRSGRPFDSDDLALLRTLAHQTAIALHNASSYEELAALTRDLDLRVREQTEELRSSNERLSRAYHDLERAQAQLVHSEKMTSLGQLVAGVAHEINNPASFVHGSLANLAEYLDAFIGAIEAFEALPTTDLELRVRLEAIRARYRLDYLVPQAPELLRICSEGSDRIRNIVADLRTFARAASGDRMPVDVREGIESTLRLIQHRLVAGGVRLVRAYGPTPPVQASPGELNQVWMNLLANAVDAVAGHAHAEITVATRTEREDGGREWLVVEIRDTGAGIDPSLLPRIFEPFFTTKPLGQGTGLGLSIAYGAVKNHGGEISVSSEPGIGTTFVVHLPLTIPGRSGTRAAA
jgi:signal transduction histidine kinase